MPQENKSTLIFTKHHKLFITTHKFFRSPNGERDDTFLQSSERMSHLREKILPIMVHIPLNRIKIIANDLKEASSSKSQFNELKSKYRQTLIENKNLKNANEILTKALKLKKKSIKCVQKILDKQILQSGATEHKWRILKKKVQYLRNKLKHKEKMIELAQEDTSAADAHISELTQQINDLLASNEVYLKKMLELEQTIKNQSIKFESDIQGFQHQLISVQTDMSKKVQEYKDLRNNTMTQDMEISAYQKPLESKDRRLSIIPNKSTVCSPRGIKRKFFQRNERENEFFNIIKDSSTIDIEISEVCPVGKFVQLFNKGSKEVALGEFELKRCVAGINISTVFKFHSSVKLGAGDSLTVWSSTGSNQVRQPSTTSIIMKTQAWMVGNRMATILLNPKRKEIAIHELHQDMLPLSSMN